MAIQHVSVAKAWSMLKLLYSPERSVKAMAARGSLTSSRPAEQQVPDGLGVTNASGLDNKLMVVDKLSSISRSSAVHKRGSQTVGDTTGTSTVDEGEVDGVLYVLVPCSMPYQSDCPTTGIVGDPDNIASSDESSDGAGEEEKQRQLQTIASGGLHSCHNWCSVTYCVCSSVCSSADFNILPDEDDLGSELSASTARESAQDWQLKSV